MKWHAGLQEEEESGRAEKETHSCLEKGGDAHGGSKHMREGVVCRRCDGWGWWRQAERVRASTLTYLTQQQHSVMIGGYRSKLSRPVSQAL